MSSLIAAPDGLKVVTPFSRIFVDGLKDLVPPTARRWDNTSKCWLVDPAYGQDMADLIKQCFGELIAVPALAISTQPEFKILRIEYIGRCKLTDGQSLASGFADGNWTVRLPESTLRTYFSDDLPERPARPDEPATPRSLYAILGIKNHSDAVAIRAAYKRMARQWHPDTCREGDAHEQMQAINRAWAVLKDDRQRRKYDMALIFTERYEADEAKGRDGQHQREVRHWRHQQQQDGYRAPLRCGWIAATGVMRLGQFWIDNILKWEDITDAQGRTMVSSWPNGATMFVIDWIAP